MITEVFIEGSRLDLFDDESISITQGVQDVKDISKLFADFSQSFSVPASKTNNLIFKNYYNADIDNGFDARTRKPALININTLPFKTGKIQLNGVKLKHGRPSSYSLTFFGDAIKVKDLVGDDKLNTLEWLDNFNHDYTSEKVLEGLTTGIDFTVDGVLYPAAVVYPLIAYQRQFKYNSDPNDDISVETLVNIAYANGKFYGVEFNELKAAIKLSLIVEAIEQKYGFNFTGSFFESQLFKDIYINLNNSTDRLSNGITEFENENANVGGFFTWSSLLYSADITPLAGFEDVEYKVRLSIEDEVIYESPYFFTGNNSFSGQFDAPSPLPQIVNVVAEVITEEDFEFDAETDIIKQLPTGSTSTNPPWPITYTNQSIDLNTIIRNDIKDLKTYDFLKGLFKTFNLIVVADGDDILVEDLPTWYASGDILDVTPFIDTKTKQVDKGVIFKNMNFKFKESKQIIADEFRQSNDRIYGNEELTLYTDSTQTTELDGDTLDIESIFENPIHERLFNQLDNVQTTIQYCPYFNREIKSISENIFMFYGLPVSVSANPIGFNGASNSYEQINGNVIMPSHARVMDENSFNLNFAAEFNEYTGGVFQDTIYNKFYSDYVSDVFSNKRRNYKYKAIFPLSILNGLKLNDRLVIGNTRYIINKITSNLVKREDSLELINDIYDAPLASDLLNSSKFNRSSSAYQSPAVTDSVVYIGLQNQTPVLVDTGDGTAFITIDSFGTSSINTITYSLTQNATGADRSVVIQVNDGINNPRFTIVQSTVFIPSLIFSDSRNSQYIPIL